MGQVGNSGDKNLSFWTDFGGLPVPAAGQEESEAVSTIRQLGEAFAADGLSKAEADTLKSLIDLSISNPELPAADKEKLGLFLGALSKAATLLRLGGGGDGFEPEVKAAINDWLSLSAAFDIFKSSNEIASLIAKMARDESKLKQVLGNLLLVMAKEIESLVIAAGEARAQQHEADARKAWLEMGLAIGQMVSICITTLVSIGKQAELEKNIEKNSNFKSDPTGTGQIEKKGYERSMEAHHHVTSEMRPLQELSSSFFSAIKSGIDAMTSTVKAGLERDAAKSEATSQLLNRIFQLMQETYSALGEDMKELKAMLDKFFQLTESVQRTSGEQWKA